MDEPIYKPEIIHPTPWRAWQDHVVGDATVIRDCLGQGVASVWNASDSQANGHLMAAAPELLAACEAALPIVELWSRQKASQYGEGWNGGEPSTLDELHAAIRKALGEEVR